MRTSNSLFYDKKIKRDTYAQYAKQLHIENDKLALQKIQAINFGEDSMIVVSKNKIVIFSIISMKPYYQREGFFYDAIFIPNTALVATVEHDGTMKSKRTLLLIDLDKNQVAARVQIKFSIQKIKATQNCICLAGIQQICILHFPTLKPICHELAGSGNNIVFDISSEGLTLAYQTQKKGVVFVHNFSSVITQKARRKSFEASKKRSVLGSMAYEPLQNFKRLVQIKAHHEYVCLIRLSPNGSRVATASNKGTLIRIFLTESGKLWEEHRVSYQISAILDINFYEQGNVICCLTEKSMVYLFNTKLQMVQQQTESQKRGYKIYQQSNPKSVFSFLSFFYNNFGNQFPFANFQLCRPDEPQVNKKQEVHSKKSINGSQNLNSPLKQQIKPMPVINQQASQLQESKLIKQQAVNKKQEQNLQELQEMNEKITRNISNLSQMSQQKRTKSLLKKLNFAQAKKESYNYAAKVYNTVSRVYVGGNNFVWVAKGPYLFSLKYDPFNGGQMYHKETIKFC